MNGRSRRVGLVFVFLLFPLATLLLVRCDDSINKQPTGPDSESAGQRGSNPVVNPAQGHCTRDGSCHEEIQCIWRSKEGVWYSLKDFINKLFQIALPNPRGSVLKFHLCPFPSSQISCKNGRKSPACITVPGVSPTSTGMEPRIEQLEPNIPSMGIRLVYDDGDVCEVTKIPRKTIVRLPCKEAVDFPMNTFQPRQAWEGTKKEICHYFVEFPPSQFGCPSKLDGQLVSDYVATGINHHGNSESGTGSSPTLVPEISAITGCHDSVPARTTEDCHFAGKIKLILHGLNFHSLCSASANVPASSISSVCENSFSDQFAVYIGEVECSQVALVSQYQINCTVEKAAGKEQDVIIKRKSLSSVKSEKTAQGEMVAILKGAVSFKERINYQERFSKFVEMGVGGLKREINELYRRAFASRGTSPELLEQLGIGHVKGILLYGPPGSGKTLLARTIGKILGSKQVSIINGPEIISKYLGESEKNLRSHFKEAHQKWKEFGPLSDLFVIIIDEIDAVCKPRGKSDQSSAGVAYDALVNQFLTLMDGLNEVHNTLVIGLTNRRELLDPALLRPGRFEVQIEVDLPDEEGRREIFEIHTREMTKNGLLGKDVNILELAANTSRFSGAEIAGIVRAASSYALERHQLKSDLVHDSRSVVVTLSDFSRAIQEVNPAYTHSESHVLSHFLPLGYLPCGEPHATVIESALDMVHVLFSSSAARFQSLLLYGPRGSGKTTMAAHLAMMGKFPFVKIITAASLVGVHDAAKIDIMHQTFRDAYKSESAVIILDDLHRLVEYIQVGHQIQVSHSLLHTLFTLLTTTPPSGAKLMVVSTMTLAEQGQLEEPLSLGLPELFTQHMFVPLLGPEEAKVFIAARNIHRSDGGRFSLPGNLAISMEQLLHSIDCACVTSEESCDFKHSSQIRQDHLLNCIMTHIRKTHQH